MVTKRLRPENSTLSSMSAGYRRRKLSNFLINDAVIFPNVRFLENREIGLHNFGDVEFAQNRPDRRDSANPLRGIFADVLDEALAVPEPDQHFEFMASRQCKNFTNLIFGESVDRDAPE